MPAAAIVVARSHSCDRQEHQYRALKAVQEPGKTYSCIYLCLKPEMLGNGQMAVCHPSAPVLRKHTSTYVHHKPHTRACYPRCCSYIVLVSVPVCSCYCFSAALQTSLPGTLLSQRLAQHALSLHATLPHGLNASIAMYGVVISDWSLRTACRPELVWRQAPSRAKTTSSQLRSHSL